MQQIKQVDLRLTRNQSLSLALNSPIFRYFLDKTLSKNQQDLLAASFQMLGLISVADLVDQSSHTLKTCPQIGSKIIYKLNISLSKLHFDLKLKGS